MTLATPWFTRTPVIERSRQVARTLVHHGLGTWVDHAGLARFAPRVRRDRLPRHTQAEHVRLALGELGATFVKLGQMLATRADLLPADLVVELAKLQDAAPAVPLADIRATIVAELGAEPEAVFATFDPVPLASASIGQVHAATLADGSRVVIKVRRPGVVEEIERDLEILGGIARWIENHTAIGEDYEVVPLVEEFAFTIRNELDYRCEGQNADRLRRFLADDPGVCIPVVHWRTTTSRVLTLERVDGVKVSDLASIDRLGVLRRAVAENAVRVFLRCALDLGLFHADPHPGNFFVRGDGSLAIVDFGMVGRLNPEVRQHLVRAGLAAMRQDAEGLAEQLYALGVAGRHAQRRAFLRDLDHVITRFGGLSLGELSATEVTRQITAIAYRHKLQLPSELALLFRVVAMSEGLGLSLDPGFRYLEYATPFFRAHWERGRSLSATLERMGRASSEAAELGVEMPRRLGRLLGRVERGEVEINVRHEGLDGFASQFQRMTNRLSLAIVLAASVVALGVALGVAHTGGLDRYMDWLFAFAFAFSLGFGAWLLLSIWRAGRR